MGATVECIVDGVSVMLVSGLKRGSLVGRIAVIDGVASAGAM